MSSSIPDGEHKKFNSSMRSNRGITNCAVHNWSCLRVRTNVIGVLVTMERVTSAWKNRSSHERPYVVLGGELDNGCEVPAR